MLFLDVKLPQKVVRLIEQRQPAGMTMLTFVAGIDLGVSFDIDLDPYTILILGLLRA